MMTQLNSYRRSTTYLTRPLLLPYIHHKPNPHNYYPLNRPYAIYSINDPDKNSSDPQAAINNPPTPHPEVHRQRCDQPGCNGLICNGLCGNFKDRKAIAHATHGHPPKEPQKKLIQLSAMSDLKKQPKSQQAVVYENAHGVGTTTQDVQATQILHDNNADMVKRIKKHEDTK
jgi:hypothetical protein